MGTDHYSVPRQETRVTKRLVVRGEVRRLVVKGFGPFRKNVFVPEAFEVHLASNERVEVFEDFSLLTQTFGETLGLSGELGGVSCIFADLPLGSSDAVRTFTMLSISRFELNATAEWEAYVC